MTIQSGIKKQGTVIRTYSDGGARGNPGPAAIGVVACDAQGRILLEHKDVIGRTTNNVAEYCALIAALTIAGEFEAGGVEAFLDSELVVRQMNGEYRVKDVNIQKLHREVRELERNFSSVKYSHVPRTHEIIRMADKLVNQALDEDI